MRQTGAGPTPPDAITLRVPLKPVLPGKEIEFKRSWYLEYICKPVWRNMSWKKKALLFSVLERAGLKEGKRKLQKDRP